jgi:hypothetical protein
LQQKYGWVPDSWEVILEPDNGTEWSGVLIGRAVAAAGARLSAAGFTPRFVVPSTMNMARTVPYFDDVYSVPGARPYLSEISYHRYAMTSAETLAAIARRASEHRLSTGMLEHIPSDYRDLHEDLKIGNVSAWEQYVLAPVGPLEPSTKPVDPGGMGALFLVDNRDPSKPVVVMMNAAKFFRHYFRYIRRGAKRIGADTTDPGFDPVAFVNTGGDTVVVVKASDAGPFSIRALPPGVYGVTYTTSQFLTTTLPDVSISAGDTLPTRIPDRGVVTVYAKPGTSQR